MSAGVPAGLYRILLGFDILGRYGGSIRSPTRVLPRFCWHLIGVLQGLRWASARVLPGSRQSSTGFDRVSTGVLPGCGFYPPGAPHVLQGFCRVF